MAPWAVANQVPPSMGFSRKEYCSGLLFPSPGDLPSPGIGLGSPALQADSLPAEPPGNPLVVLQSFLLLPATNGSNKEFVLHGLGTRIYIDQGAWLWEHQALL